MLGRYVTLTVAILAVAMLYAPERERPSAPVDRGAGADRGAGLVSGGAVAPVPVPGPVQVPATAPAQAVATAPAEPAGQTTPQSPVEAPVEAPVQAAVPTAEPDPGALVLGVEAALSQALRPAPDPQGGLFMVADTRVNLRAGPSTGFDILRTLEPGDLVDILSEGGGWAEVRVEEDGTIGHMARRFLVEAP